MLDECVLHLRAVKAFDGAAVKAEQIDAMLFDQFEQRIEALRVVESNARFHGEKPLGSGFAQSAQNPIGMRQIALEQVRRTGKGCLSYLVGASGEAAVIDPSLPSDVYLEAAATRGCASAGCGRSRRTGHWRRRGAYRNRASCRE